MIVLVPDEYGVERSRTVAGIEAVSYETSRPRPEELAGAEVLVAGGFAAATLDSLVAAAPSLRYIQTLGAGVEQWAGRVPEGVRLVNARGAHGAVSAEWAVAALLSVVREFPRFRDQQKEGKWAAFTAGSLLGAQLLILGAGDLADELVKRVEPFGVTVVRSGRRPRQGVITLEEARESLSRFDVVVAMLPLTSETRRTIDSDFLARMRDGAILVNVGRGGLVDTDALLAELVSGRLRAALDVTDPEPLPDAHPLWSAPGVFITPHAGGDVGDWTERAWDVVVRQLNAIAVGELPENLVDY